MQQEIGVRRGNLFKHGEVMHRVGGGIWDQDFVKLQWYSLIKINKNLNK